MGNNKFKLSNMIPNSLLYKLKHLTKPPSNKTPPDLTTINKNKFSITPHMTSPSTVAPPPCGSRKSYHFTRDLPLSPPGDPPLISPPTTHHKAKPKKPTKTNRSGTQTRFDSVQPGSVLSQNGSGKPGSSFDIVINVDEWINGVDFQLPRIATKPGKPVGPVQSRGYPVKSPAFGVRLRLNSPKIIMGIKQGQNGNYTCRKSVGKKRGLTKSLAVVKSSDDPKRDFKESMVEMIVENNLKGSKDLEDLLACYLSLNSDEYHDVIIQVFKQIWCDLSGINK